jgi:hypothetical protein
MAAMMPLALKVVHVDMETFTAKAMAPTQQL